MSGRIVHTGLVAMAVVAFLVLACSGSGTTPQPATGSPPPAAVVTATPAAVSTATPAPTPAPTASPTTAPSPTGTPSPATRGKFTIVSGVEEYLPQDTGSITTEDGVDKGRGLTLKNVDVANDPRVSGTTTETWNFDFAGLPPAAGLDWGTRRLENEGGAWEGIVLGAAFPGHREELTMWLAGSGGYAGLTYYMHAFTSGSAAQSGAYPFEGIIYEGTIPMPTLPTP